MNMNKVKQHIIGIVGGMGPEAGVRLVQTITNLTDASADQDHLPLILMSFPGSITDRTAYLEGRNSINPAGSIVNIIDKLADAGADIVGIACNTSHAPRIFEVIINMLGAKKSPVQLLNMPFETCRFIQSEYSRARRIGLMATNGTYHFGVYDTLLKQMGYEVVLPDPVFQNDVIHRMIYDPVVGLKANAGYVTNEVKLWYRQALHFFEQQETDLVILGCTELSALNNNGNTDMTLVDTTYTLALALMRAAKNEIALSQTAGVL